MTDNGDGAFTHGFNDYFEHRIDGETVADAFSFTNQGNHGRSSEAAKTITSNGACNFNHDNSVFAPSTSTIPRPPVTVSLSVTEERLFMGRPATDVLHQTTMTACRA